MSWQTNRICLEGVIRNSLINKNDGSSSSFAPVITTSFFEYEHSLMVAVVTLQEEQFIATKIITQPGHTCAKSCHNLNLVQLQPDCLHMV